MRRHPAITADSEPAGELNDVAGLREGMAKDIQDAKAALVAYGAASLSFVERLLWASQLDLIVRAKYDNNKLVISLEVPPEREGEKLSGPAESFKDIIDEYLKRLTPKGDLLFDIQSNLMLTKSEANRIRQSLGLRHKLGGGKHHEDRKQKRK